MLDEEQIKREALLLLFSRRIPDEVDWKYQCPPERRGAAMGLLRVLTGKSWKELNDITLNGNLTEAEEKKALFGS